MSWTVVSPVLAETSRKTAVVETNVPYFPDEIDYEELLGQAFASPTDRDRLASGMLVIMATQDGAMQMHKIYDAPVVVPFRDTLVRLALHRQIVVLRWLP